MGDSGSERPSYERMVEDADRSKLETKRRRLEAEREGRAKKAAAALALLVGLTATLSTSLSTVLSVFDKRYVLDNIFSNTGLLWSLGGLFLSVAFSLVLSIFLNNKKEKNFDLYDVDRLAMEQKRAIEQLFLSKAARDVYDSRKLLNLNEPPSDQIDERATRPEAYIALSFMSDFGRYLSGLIRYLNAQVEQSDSKASVLLVTGKMYVRRGIYFFVASIVFWQIYGYFSKEISHVMIVGMVSCSLTFLVVEFMAAWFLRQYKEYVDAAIVYAKIKTQFDSIMLAYLSLKEFEGGGQEYIRDEMAKVLKEPIMWPESVKQVDLNHMKQMFESFSKLAGKLVPLMKKEADKQ